MVFVYCYNPLVPRVESILANLPASPQQRSFCIIACASRLMEDTLPSAQISSTLPTEAGPPCSIHVAISFFIRDVWLGMSRRTDCCCPLSLELPEELGPYVEKAMIKMYPMKRRMISHGADTRYSLAIATICAACQTSVRVARGSFANVDLSRRRATCKLPLGLESWDMMLRRTM